MKNLTLTFDEDLHKYTDGNGLTIPSVTQIMKTAGLVNLDWIPVEILEAKADLGKKVHSATELYDRNDLNFDALHPALMSYLNGWIKFRKDFKFEPTEIEMQLLHTVYRYAGRIDRVGLMGSDLTLLDIKSGTKQKTHAIQTAGYELLYNQNKKGIDLIKRRLVVYLSPDSYEVEEHKNKNDKSIFLAALTITNYLNNIRRPQ